jgi:dihydrofolate synthase / folylpolyglutamate synthase
MNFRQALADLDGRQSESMPEPGLDRIRAVADLLDHPELAYPSIHVTGTNGKTTTARMVTALACAHGLTTGTFTSPHLESVTERLSVCGEDIAQGEFAEEYGRLLPYLEQVDGPEMRVTYFEALTALAYVWFADKPVGLGVLEVGMGGTWDATNLIRGDVAVVCPIGLDHVQYLGSTIAEIATEKAGVIKEGKIVVVRRQRAEAMEVLEERCHDVGAKLRAEGEAFTLTARTQAVGGQAIAVRGSNGSYPDLFLPLYGEQAARNGAASIAACEALLGRDLDVSAVRIAFEQVRSPGRIEVSARHPLVVLDGAHNADAMAALVETLGEAFDWDRLHLVAGMLGDKDVEGVLRVVAPLTDRAYACANTSPRSTPPERVAAALRSAGVDGVETFATVADAAEAAREGAGDGDMILVTGSFYTVADARPLFVGT